MYSAEELNKLVEMVESHYDDEVYYFCTNQANKSLVVKVLDIKEIIAYWENYAEATALIIEDSYDNYFEDLGERLSVCEATLDVLRQLD